MSRLDRVHRLGLVLFVTAIFGCKSTDIVTHDDLPTFNGPPFKIGGLLCVSGSFSAKASTMEQIAVLAAEYINGSTHAYDMPADQIPCRVNGTCGAWMGRDAAGNEIRGPVEVLVADSEGRPDRAVAAAQELRDA